MKAILLKMHRWIALAFSLPLAILIVSGLILSIEPTVNLFNRNVSKLTADRAVEALKQYDPAGQARAIQHRAYDRSLEIVAPSGTKIVDLDTLELRDSLGLTARLIEASRSVHLTFLLDVRWLVHISTYVMMAVLLIGLMMGPARMRATLSGWHRAAAWIALPFLIASPITGILMALNITFGGGASAPMGMGGRPPMMPMAQVVEEAAKSRDLTNMVWIRQTGPRYMMRYMEEGRFQGYFLAPGRLNETPRNWPRSYHEGLWIGQIGPILNILTSVVFGGLLITGLVLWMRRRKRFARRAMRAEQGAAA